jgi:hypothetical protein
MVKEEPLIIQKATGRKKGSKGITIQIYKQSERPMRTTSITIHGGEWLTIEWVKGMLTYFLQGVSYAMHEGKKFDIIIKNKKENKE